MNFVFLDILSDKFLFLGGLQPEAEPPAGNNDTTSPPPSYDDLEDPINLFAAASAPHQPQQGTNKVQIMKNKLVYQAHKKFNYFYV